MSVFSLSLVTSKFIKVLSIELAHTIVLIGIVSALTKDILTIAFF